MPLLQMMHTHRDYSHGTLFSSCFRKLHSMSARSPKLLQEIKQFDDALALQLDDLTPKDGDGKKILQLSWLSRLLALAHDKHAQAVSLVPPLDFPLRVCDEEWMNEYMDQTARMLDVCNALTGALSNIEQGHLLIRHACHILLNAENPSSQQGVQSSDVHVQEECLSRAHKSLREWLDVQVSTASPSQKYCTILQDMMKDLRPPRDRALARGKGFLYALYGSNAVAVLAFYVLTLSLSRESELVTLTLSIPPTVSWSASITHVVQVAKDEVKEQKDTIHCIGDLGPLDASVKGLLSLIEQALGSEERPLAQGTEEELAKAVNDLSLQMDEIAKGLELLGTKLNEMFKTIVLSRSELLDKLGDFGTEDV